MFLKVMLSYICKKKFYTKGKGKMGGKDFFKEVGKNAVQKEVRRTTNAILRRVIVGSIAVTLLVIICIVIAITN